MSERRAALTALTRKYGETIDEVLAWAEDGAKRLLDLDDTDGRIGELEARRDRLRGRARRARGHAERPADDGRRRASAPP